MSATTAQSGVRHVCLIGPIPPPWGGVQTHMVELRKFLRAAGVRVSMINITRHRAAEQDDQHYPHSAVELLATIRRLRPDIVHVHAGGELAAKYAGLFLALRAFPGLRTCFTFHSGGFPSSPTGRKASPTSFRGLALRSLDAVIAVNPELVSTLRRYGIEDRRLHLVPPHFATLDRAEIASAELPAAVESFRHVHSPLLVSVGLLEEEYCVEKQFEALRLVRDQLPSAGLLVIGSGSLHEELERQRAALVPEGAMLVGDLGRPATLKILSLAEVVLRTTKYDGDALSVREALALGRRVLASDNGMRPDGVTLLPSLDPKQISGAIRDALASEPPVNSVRAPESPGVALHAIYRSVMRG